MHQESIHIYLLYDGKGFIFRTVDMIGANTIFGRFVIQTQEAQFVCLEQSSEDFSEFIKSVFSKGKVEKVEVCPRMGPAEKQVINQICTECHVEFAENCIVYELPLIQSTQQSLYEISYVHSLNPQKVGQDIHIRGFVSKVRGKFAVLRSKIETIQAFTVKAIKVPAESYVEVFGKLIATDKPVSNCSIQNFEIHADSISVITKSQQPLPILVEDCSRVNDMEEDVSIKQQRPEGEGEIVILALPGQQDFKIAVNNNDLVFNNFGEKRIVKFAYNAAPKQGWETKKPFKDHLPLRKWKKVLEPEAFVREMVPTIAKNLEVELTEEVANATLKKMIPLIGYGESYDALPLVSQKSRLDNRVLDLRTVANQAIFRIQSKVCQFFREFLCEKDFQEIHTPKLIATASEGGSNVFEVKYFDGKAYLAQSPQLYKQMSVVSGMMRVFEIGPVFRAEKSFTHRHLTEFTGLDAEMAFDNHYHEALTTFRDLLATVFRRLQTECKKEIEAVRSQFPSEDLLINPVIIPFHEGVRLLRESGATMDDFQDLDTALEKKLGAIIREKYNTDFYILDKFPAAVRPFYTMPDPVDPRYSNSYDFFLRGEEIVSGAQRIHDSDLLLRRAQELKVDLSPIQAYVDCFRYGAPPHAGLGCGLDRITFLFLGLRNVRRGSLFPRDPQRITP